MRDAGNPPRRASWRSPLAPSWPRGALAKAWASQCRGCCAPGICRPPHWRRRQRSDWQASPWGALFGGIAADRFGRRTLLVAALAALGATTIGCGLSADRGQLTVWRVFHGLALGGALPAFATIIAESTLARSRRLALAIGIAFLPLGGFIAGQVAALVPPTEGWRAVFSWNGGIALAIAVVTPALLPESPRLLATRPNHRGKLLGVMARIGHPIDRLGILTNAHSEPRSSCWKAAIAAVRPRDTAALWVATFLIILVMYSMFSWLPTALASKALPLASASRAISSLSAGGIVGGVASGWLTQRFGSCATLLVLAVFGAGAAMA